MEKNNTEALTYDVGKSIDGKIIKSVLSRNTLGTASYIIFEDENEDKLINIRIFGDMPKEAIEILARYKELRYELRSVPQYIFPKLNLLLVHSLDTAFSSLDDCDINQVFTKIIKEIDENKKHHIISSTEQYHIYIDENGKLVSVYDNNFFKVNENDLIKFHYLKNNIISSEFSENKYKQDLNVLLGTSLSHVLSNNNINQNNNYFLNVENELTLRRQETVKHNYVSATLLMMLIFSIIACIAHLIIPNELYWGYNIYTSAMAGALGALLSTLQRRNKLEFNQNISMAYVRTEGIIRIFLGIIFGSLAFTLSQADITFGFLNNYAEHGRVYALFIYSMIAGLSERLIPDVLDNVEKNTLIDKKSAQAVPE